jgi:hypothetical protein
MVKTTSPAIQKPPLIRLEDIFNDILVKLFKLYFTGRSTGTKRVFAAGKTSRLINYMNFNHT